MKKFYLIVAIATFTLASAQNNLLSNPGFEEGLAPWKEGTTLTFTAPIISDTVFHSGSKSAGYLNTTDRTGFYQNIPLKPNTEYVMKFWYNSTAHSTSKNIARIWSLYRNAAGTLAALPPAGEDPLRNYNKYLPVTNGEWREHSFEFTSLSDAAGLDVAFRVFKNATVYFDDIFIAEKSTLTTGEVSPIAKRALVKSTVVSNTHPLVFIKSGEIQIVNMNGQIIKTLSVSEGTEINTSFLSAGIYMVTGIVNGEKVAQKIIKQ